MFRALTCPSSGEQIVLSQHLVSSLSVQYSTESDDTRCCDNIICPPEDGHVNDMFRALTCLSSGGQIVLSQHLVSSISVQYSRVQYAG